ncbi:MAG TPA: pilin [Candidatus Magasanikbacteria bacterium]|nr:pilin [Candidatus Magasanikbacteria bacterium]
MKKFFATICLMFFFSGLVSVMPVRAEVVVPTPQEETTGVGAGAEVGGVVGAPVSGEALNTDIQKQLDALAGSTGAGYGPARDPRSIVARYVKYALGLMGTIATIFAVYAGYLILMSGGEDEKVNEGKRVLKQVIIGAIILLSAYSIVLLVERYLTGNTDNAWQEGNIGGYDFNWKIEENTDLPKDRYIY